MPRKDDVSQKGHILKSAILAKSKVPVAKNNPKFDPKKFLAIIGEGRRIVSIPKNGTIYSQGAACDAVFYIQNGKVKLTVLSKKGKEATVGILNPVISLEKVALLDSLSA